MDDTNTQQQQQPTQETIPAVPPATPPTLHDGFNLMAGLMDSLSGLATEQAERAELDPRTGGSDLGATLIELGQEAQGAARRLEAIAVQLAVPEQLHELPGGEAEAAADVARDALAAFNHAAGPLPPSVAVECWRCKRRLLISATDAPGYNLTAYTKPAESRGVTLPCPFCMGDRGGAFPLELVQPKEAVRS